MTQDKENAEKVTVCRAATKDVSLDATALSGLEVTFSH